MSCLKIADIYAYLEEELPAGQREKIERHLSVCSRCRDAVEERRLLTEAASSLPDLDIPADFTERVMAKIAPAKRHLPVWLIAFAAGLSSLTLLLTLVVISGEGNLLSLWTSLSHSLWANAKNAVVLMAKLITVLSAAGKVLSSLFHLIYKGFSLLTSLISPAAQILIMTLTLVLFITLFYLLRKKFMLGEKI